MQRIAGLALALAIVATTGAGALAQPVRVRGTITGFAANTLTVASREGQVLTVTLADPIAVIAVQRVPPASITTGAYVGISAAPGPGGSWRAQEVLLLPEALRGAGEGQRPWDLTPDSTMVNATIDGVVTGANGKELHLKHKDGTVQIILPPDVPMVTLVPAGPADIKPGQGVFLTATKGADGSLSASRLTVGKDGVAPPM
jgi:hypothetical protein